MQATCRGNSRDGPACSSQLARNTSVRRLAKRCGASLTVHEPLRLRNDHHVGNKLRGLEIEPATDRFLLLDVDIAILSDLSPLGDLGTCVAASPEDAPNLTVADWRTIYGAFDLPLPAMIRPLLRELDLPCFPRRMMGYEAGDDQLDAMLPYYNGGVVFAPWDCDLRGLWERSILRITGLYDDSGAVRKWIHHSDQAALAMSIASLQAAGRPFRRLPDAFNTRWQHLYAGTPAVEEIAVMHCCWSFLSAIGAGPADEPAILRALDDFFLRKLRNRFRKLAFGDVLRLRPLAARRRLANGRDRAARICADLRRVIARHTGESTAVRPG